MKFLKQKLKRKGYVPVKLKVLKVPEADTFHFLVKAGINNKKGNFILDTGASTTVVDINKAKKFKLNIPDEQPEMTAFGASPEQLDVRYTARNKIGIKKWTGGKFPVLLMDLSHIAEAMQIHDVEIDGILGADVLIAGKAILDYGKKYLYLKKRKT
jgi:hypothetical protein